MVADLEAGFKTAADKQLLSSFFLTMKLGEAVQKVRR
jgi:hypothetical protein